MINHVEKGYGMLVYLSERGCFIEQLQDGTWISTKSDEETNELIESYNPWPVEKNKKLLEINSWLDSEAEKLNALIPESDQRSWQVQVNEAFGLMPINLLGQLADDRGIDLADLIERVKTKHSEYWTAYGKIKAKRDNIKDLIKTYPDNGSVERLYELWSLSCTA